MEPCICCKRPTCLYDCGVPICPDCDERRQAAKTDDGIDLRRRVIADGESGRTLTEPLRGNRP